jgi:hypothetical protein
MAKRKRGLAAYKKKTKRAKKNNEIVKQAKSNPPPMKDLAEFVVPGFAGYAGTRLASRIIHGVVLKKAPRLAKHASVLSTLASAAGAWFLVHRVARIKESHTPVVVGASIAAIQTVVQAYLPKYGWMVSDHNLQAQTPAQASARPAPRKSTEDGRWNGLLPSDSSGTALPPPIETLTTAEISDELDDLDMGVLTSTIGTELSDAEMDAMIDDASLMN